MSPDIETGDLKIQSNWFLKLFGAVSRNNAEHLLATANHNNRRLSRVNKQLADRITVLETENADLRNEASDRYENSLEYAAERLSRSRAQVDKVLKYNDRKRDSK